MRYTETGKALAGVSLKKAQKNRAACHEPRRDHQLLALAAASILLKRAGMAGLEMANEGLMNKEIT